MGDTLNTWDFKLRSCYDRFAGGKGNFLEDHITEVWRMDWRREKSLFAIPWTVAYQAPPSMEFSKQESWRRLLFPSPGDLPNPVIESRSPALQADFFCFLFFLALSHPWVWINVYWLVFIVNLHYHTEYFHCPENPHTPPQHLSHHSISWIHWYLTVSTVFFPFWQHFFVVGLIAQCVAFSA